MRLPPARATIAIVLVTALAWLSATSAGQDERVAQLAGFIPARWTSGLAIAHAAPAWLTPLSATLVHGGLWHVAFNILMIGFCGRLVEASIGPLCLVVLYVVGAYAAAGAQWLIDPASVVPMIGASGAGSAVIAAYALLYSRQTVKNWGPIPGKLIHVLWLAAAWIGLQALIGLTSTGIPGIPPGDSIGTAAHVGGFLAGLALARPLLLYHYRKA